MAGHDEKVRILLVEDDPTAAALTSAEIGGSTAARFTIAHHDTLAGGLSALDAEPFDLILLDLGLPDAFGLQALQAFISHPRRPCCVVMSATENEELTLAAIEIGAQAFIHKGTSTRQQTELAILTSIARHRRQERAATAASELRRAFEALPTPLLVIGGDGRVAFANAAAGALYGRDPKWLIGQRFGADTSAGEGMTLRILPQGGAPMTVEMRAAEATWQGRAATLVTLRAPWPTAEGGRPTAGDKE